MCLKHPSLPAAILRCEGLYDGLQSPYVVVAGNQRIFQDLQADGIIDRPRRAFTQTFDDQLAHAFACAHDSGGIHGLSVDISVNLCTPY